jgi:excisionase family DNA binding protein
VVDSLSVREAAARLDVSPVAVRQQIADGRLRAVKRGRDWWIDPRAVERMRRLPARSGRPLSAALAWAVLLLASGEEGAADRVVQPPRYRTRARAWLREHSLSEEAGRLRARAAPEEFEAHPSELRRIAARTDVLLTGASAGGLVGLAGEPATVEVYAPAGQREAIVREHALVPGAGSARIRWVADEIWDVLRGDVAGPAPRAAVLLDLVESDEPRGRREAMRALAPQGSV